MDSLLFSPEHLVVAGALNDVMIWTFRFLFFASAILLMVIVLLQEGKGGGLASALGGQGAETFGVSTGGVNKVTLFLAGLFLVSALGHALAFDQTVTKSLRDARKGKAPPEDPFKDITLPRDGEKGDSGGGGGASGGGSGTEKKQEPAAPPPAPPPAPPKDAPKSDPPKEETPKAPPPSDPKR